MLRYNSGGNMFSSFLFDKDDYNDVFFTKEEYQIIKDEMNRYEDLQAIVIEVLKIVQRRRGWITDSDIVSIAKFLKMSVSDIEGVATFYNQIFRKPVGRHIIRFCDSIVCYITGCKNIRLEFEDILNIKQGETSVDNRFTFLPICCLGRCDQSPVVMVDEDFYLRVSLQDVKGIIEKYA